MLKKFESRSVLIWVQTVLQRLSAELKQVVPVAVERFKTLCSTGFVVLSHVNGDQNNYKIAVPMINAAYNEPSKSKTNSYIFSSFEVSIHIFFISLMKIS